MVRDVSFIIRWERDGREWEGEMGWEEMGRFLGVFRDRDGIGIW